MIDKEFILRYTDALYCSDPTYAPTYTEFRDMLSRGQLESKIWLINEFEKICSSNIRSIILVGSWFGTLGFMLADKYPEISVRCLDIDPRCEYFIRNIIDTMNTPMDAITDDMIGYSYVEDVIINTSCEHVPDLQQWLNTIPTGTTVIMQSNNAKDIDDHSNCFETLDEFKSSVISNFSDIMFSGELEFPMYKRFMIIGVI